MYQRILVATDGSTLSKKAVSSAIAMAQLTGAELVALKVIPRYPQSYFEGGLALPASDIARVEKQWAEHGQSIVDAVSKTALGKGVKVKAVTAKSDLVSEAIIAAAKKHKCDLIVMASQKALPSRGGPFFMVLASANPFSRTGACTARAAGSSAPCPWCCAAARRPRSSASES